MILSANSKREFVLVVIAGLVTGCGGGVGGSSSRLTTEEFVEAVDILTTDVECRDTRLKQYWGFGWTPQELVHAVLGHPVSTSSLKFRETLNIYRTSNGTVTLQVWDVDGIPPDAPKTYRLQIVNQTSTQTQPVVNRERLKKQILAIKLRFDPRDSGALAAEMWEQAKQRDEQEIRSRNERNEALRKQAEIEREAFERKVAAEQDGYRRKAAENALKYAEQQEKGRDESQADRDYVTLRDKISDRELRMKLSKQYEDWFKRRAALLGEQRREGKDRRTVPLPSVAAVEEAILSGTEPIPVGE